MSSQISYIIPSAKQMLNYSQSLLVGITEDIFARKPRTETGVLQLNHPAFNYGHLSIYPALILEMLNLPYEDLSVTDSYKQLFKNGAECLDDPEAKIYPSMKEITDKFTNSYNSLLERIPNATLQALNDVTPGERVARFPVKGAFLAHLITSHLAVHLGQVSAWRRAMKLPPA
jgi:DinB superfamily